MSLCVCLYVHARVCESWAGSGVESGFCDACLIFDCLRSPPPTLSCHSTEHTPTSSDREHWPFRIRHTLAYNLARTDGRTQSQPFLYRDAIFKPDLLETQHQCGKATISGQDAAILFQSVSAALRRYASLWPSDETGVPLKWLTDRWCQQHWWGERRGERERA